MVSFAAKVGFVPLSPGSGSEYNDRQDLLNGVRRPRHRILNRSFRDEFDRGLRATRPKPIL
jgi:hypothetical protein